MGHNKYLSKAVKKLIVQASNNGKTVRQISIDMNMPRSTVGYTLKVFQQRSHFQVSTKSGRPILTTFCQDNVVVRSSKADRRKSAKEIHREFTQSHQISCSYATVKRRIRQNNLFGHRPVKKSFVSAKNRRARLKFAKEHLNWTANQWSKIIWSDESKFNMFGSDGIKYVQHPIGLRNDVKYQVPTVKHGSGSVMVWSCFSRDRVGPIYRVQGIMDQNMYKGIIKDIMLPHAKDKKTKCCMVGLSNTTTIQNTVAS